MSTLAHKQEALAYQAIVSLAQERTVIRAMHLRDIGDKVIQRAVRNGVILRTTERGVYFSGMKVASDV